MKLAIAIAFLLASSLTAQAQHGGSKNRTLGNAYGAASGSSSANASPIGGRSQTNNTQYGTYTGGGNVNPWNDRTCY